VDENHDERAVEPGLHLLDPVQVHDRRSMNANEALGIEQGPRWIGNDRSGFLWGLMKGVDIWSPGCAGRGSGAGVWRRRL
jgi:hypothetical protein